MRSILLGLLLLAHIGCEKPSAPPAPPSTSAAPAATDSAAAARVPESPAPSASDPPAPPPAPPPTPPPAPPPAPVVRTGKVWPFHEYVSAEAVVFNQFEIKPGVQFVAYNDRGWTRHIAKRQKITPAQMKAATDLINDTKGGVVVSKCAFPRHAIVLFDADDVPVASINVCFQCGDILIWPDWTKPPHDWEKLEKDMMRNAAVRMRRYDVAFPKWKKLFRDELGFGPDIEKEWRPSPNGLPRRHSNRRVRVPRELRAVQRSIRRVDP